MIINLETASLKWFHYLLHTWKVLNWSSILMQKKILLNS